MLEQEFWSGKSVLVTGATGLVGSALVAKLLSFGASVTAFVPDVDPLSRFYAEGTVSKVRVIMGRLERYDDVERALNNSEASFVFHLGAQPIVGVANRLPRHTFEANVQGTWNLLDGVRQLQSRINGVVVASSDKAYGTGPLPYTESTPLAGEHPYDVSKSCTDLISRSYFSTYQLPVVIARCGNIYGPGDLNWNRVVPGTIRSLLNGKPPVIRSNGQYCRDYVYIDDVVESYLLLGERAGEHGVRGEAFNFSTETPFTVLEVVTKIASLMGLSNLRPVILNQANNEILDQFLDSSKARTELGWKAQVNFADGLERTISWYKEHLEGTRYP